MISLKRNSFGVSGRMLLVLLGLLVCASNFVASIPVPSCPNDCECSTNQYNHHMATCTDVHSNGFEYSDIKILILKPSQINGRCEIPKDVPNIFPELNLLKLSNCSLTHVPTNYISRLSYLQEIDFSNNFIRNLSESLFAANENLHYVNLENNPLISRTIRLLESNSIEKLNLARCDLPHLDVDSFKGLPNLRHLNLADNLLQTIPEGSLPKTLKSLNVSGNQIENVPLIELNRLVRLNEIDLSYNPINCSCELMGFQNWMSGKGTIFRNHIKCAQPAEYAGKFLSSVPQYEMCDAKVQQTHEDELSSNKISLNDAGFQEEMISGTDEDEFIFDVQINSVVDQDDNNRDKKRRRNSRTHRQAEHRNADLFEGSGSKVEGSGDDDQDEIEIAAQKKGADGYSKPENESSTELAATKNENIERTTLETLDGAPTSSAAAETSAQSVGESTSSSETDTNQSTTNSSTEFASSTANENSEQDTTTKAEISVDQSTDRPVSETVAAEETTVTKIYVQTTFESTESSASGVSSTQPADSSTQPADSSTPVSAVVQETTSSLDRRDLPTNGSDQSELLNNKAVQGYIKKSETDVGGERYIIPTLLIVAVVLICFSVYMSQNNCRLKNGKDGGPDNQDDLKLNNTTEMQDVNLLTADTARSEQRYSKKYQNSEGENTQTEKLMCNGDEDYSDENATLQPSNNDDVPDPKKSTTRVTKKYESQK